MTRTEIGIGAGRGSSTKIAPTLLRGQRGRLTLSVDDEFAMPRAVGPRALLPHRLEERIGEFARHKGETSMISTDVHTDDHLWSDFQALCDFGGRLSGTPSEAAAMQWLRTRGADACGVACRNIPVHYGGWQAVQASLTLADGQTVQCQPLVRSIGTGPGGLTSEVVDLGRGTPEEFEAHQSDISGRIVLVRHELMFSAGTIHRRRKYDLACELGAVGFLIAGPLQGDVIAGSSGRMGEAGIPALGISPESAARLARTAQGWPSATLDIAVEERQAETSTLIFDMPGQTDEWVVLCAHVDGHDLAESAMDNATGVAAALAAARSVASRVSSMKRGLRLAFFSVEEWALTGSAQYVEALDAAARSSIAVVINLDSVGGNPRLAALTSGFAGLEPFLLRTAEAAGHSLRCVRPLMFNSDHANFAAAGIPALRLVAGYDDPASNLRLVLTSADTRDKVARSELAAAADLAAALVHAACDVSEAESRSWRS